MDLTHETRKATRKRMRAARNSLSAFSQRKASRQLSLQLQLFFKKNLHKNRFSLQRRDSALTIAAYKSADGEIDPALFLETNKTQKLAVFFPIIQPNKTLKFGQPTRGKCPKRNRYGLQEPSPSSNRKIQTLDIVLVPLVAATPQCDRLGMGGGFYDRSFATLRQWKRKPILIGIAHQLQIVDSLPLEAWDYPLDYVITDKHCFKAT